MREPASSEQLDVWLACQREPESDRYNVTVDLEFTPTVDVPALRAALTDVLTAHPALRCAFATEGGELWRSTEADPPMAFVTDRLPGRYDRAQALARAVVAGRAPFDLATAPLVRATLLTGEGGALLAVTMHHIVSDGWSSRILAEDLVTAYRSRTAGAPGPAPRRSPDAGADATAGTSADATADIVAETGPRAGTGTGAGADGGAAALSPRAVAGAETPAPVGRDADAGVEADADGDADADAEAEAEAEEYWTSVLRDAPASLAPPHDLVPEDGFPGPSGRVEVLLPAEVHAGVQALAAAERGSPAVVLLAAWSVLLHAWAGESEGTFGMVFAGRRYADAERVDLFSRALPLRDRTSPDDRFLEVAARLREQMLDAMEHAHLPVRRLRAIRSARANGPGVERTVFMYTPAYEDAWQAGEVTVRRFDHPDETTKYEFSLNVLEGAAGTRLCVYYDTARYLPATAQLFAEELRELLARAVAAPDSTCGDLLAACDPGLSEVAAHGAPVASPAPSIPGLVLRHAAARPDAVAVRHGQRTLGYGELAARAGEVAGWLRDRGVGPGDTVALLLAPGVETPVFWLASALAGAAYLPLDPAYPQAQLQLIVDDARPAVLVVDPDCGQSLDVPEGTAVPVGEALERARGRSAPEVAYDDTATLCVLYTSGTTGRPKGVVLPHRGLARLFVRPDFLPLDETDVVAQLCPLNFDGASYEIWGALTHGAQLVVLDKHLVLSPREMRTVVRERGVSTLLVTTPLLNRIIEDAPDLLQSLRRVYFGGELISVRHMRRALRWSRPGVLLHSYGPTENSFTSTWYPITDLAPNARTVPIGRPVPGTEVRVVQEGGIRPVPRGVPGELLLGGAGLADGYLNAPGMTADRFVTDGTTRLYRTGDRVRWRPDGLLEFIGRKDNQVKIRSQRVELGEVEAVLDAHPAVESVFVTTRVNRRDEKEIVAYAVAAPGTDADEIGRHARLRLPAFAVPSHLLLVGELPLTPTGKIDRRRLPDPERTSRAAGPDPAPVPASALAPAPPSVTSVTSVTPASEASGTSVASVTDGVRAAWRAVLEHDGFGSDRNFFDAGGHSLLLVKLREHLRLTTGADVPVIDLLRHVTVHEQARLIATAHRPGGGTAAPASVVPRRPLDRAPSGKTVPAPVSPPGPRIVALSAATADALAVARERLAAHLEANPDLALADVAHTLDVGRRHFGHRCAVVASDPAEAVRALRAPHTATPAVPGSPPAVVFAFADGPPDGADRAAGPLTRQLRLADRFAERGVTPAAVYGVGTGRFAAAVVSGALTAEEGVRLAADGAAARVPVPRRPRLLWSTALGPLLPDGPAPQEQHLSAEAEPAKLLRAAGDRLGEVAVLDIAAVDPDERALLTALAALWCQGAEVRLTPPGPARRLRLPGHPLSWAFSASPLPTDS
ncbi:non-ribosomal peptide synthetase [Streptomyces rishiriensis]|uniref:Amino acid adenylation domain-containing protein n=1 Tax=Streptomyces rishiriensis TaxID=68264 RepID=A0ABU0NP24_STRRH|nr:amino acid adenylation domain-containing protein [Streptomyces rishiriensis]MDQ0580839.1 amino acid adenylation domain-containing protein [Streptomyces rishiriensis]